MLSVFPYAFSDVLSGLPTRGLWLTEEPIKTGSDHSMTGVSGGMACLTKDN